MIDLEKDYYELDQFLGGYFYQSWASGYFWTNGKPPSFEDVVRHYKTEVSSDVLAKTVHQLEAILQLPINDDDFETMAVNFTTSGFSPMKTQRGFLNRVLEILKEPRPQKSPLVRK